MWNYAFAHARGVPRVIAHLDYAGELAAERETYGPMLSHETHFSTPEIDTAACAVKYEMLLRVHNGPGA